MTDSILYNQNSDGVATVTLNRADKHNAFDDQIIDELTRIFSAIDTDDSVRLMVLAAHGKSFSAGADLSWMQRMANYSYDENVADAKALATMLNTLNVMGKPTIARVQGAAFGGAVGLVSCCDLAVGSGKASFSLSEVKIGLIPATIAPYVIAAIGERAARRYFLTAERFNADQALALGLLTDVVEHDQLDDALATRVNQLLTNSPAAITQAKELVFSVSKQAIDDALINETCERIAKIRVSQQGQEGLNAFLEKRHPNWLASPDRSGGVPSSSTIKSKADKSGEK